jgi:6-oxo-cyclohex-1-ene-carbonyl-CoA hydrolase
MAHDNSTDPLAVAEATKPAALTDHNLVPDAAIAPGVLYEKRPAKRADGSVAEGLTNAWVILDNPKQL